MRSPEENDTSTLALLDRLKLDLPEAWDHAEVVGNWVWLEFNLPPVPKVRSKLKELGFHWNRLRKCWQNPCGQSCPRSRKDPRERYSSIPVASYALRDRENLASEQIPREYKVVALKECPLPEEMLICDTPAKTAEYWKLHVATNPYFNPECECMAVLFLNTRRRVKGHQLISLGTMDTLLIHPREVFRGAVIAGAAAIVAAHNHPSGEPNPSAADIHATRDLIRAGQLMKIELLDHVVIGNGAHCSLRELGVFS